MVMILKPKLGKKMTLPSGSKTTIFRTESDILHFLLPSFPSPPLPNPHHPTPEFSFGNPGFAGQTSTILSLSSNFAHNIQLKVTRHRVRQFWVNPEVFTPWADTDHMLLNLHQDCSTSTELLGC